MVEYDTSRAESKNDTFASPTLQATADQIVKPKRKLGDPISSQEEQDAEAKQPLRHVTMLSISKACPEARHMVPLWN